MKVTISFNRYLFLAVLAPIAGRVPSIAQASGPACTAADSCNELTQVGAPIELVGRRSGRTLDIQDDVLVVGGSISTSAPGLANVFRRLGNNWQLEQTLQAQNPQYGSGAAIDGDVIIVGSPRDGGTDVGAAYVFRWNGSVWIQEVRLTPPFPVNAQGRFGTAVTIQGDIAAVGAPNVENAPLSGAVFIFRYSGSKWTQEAKLTPSDPSDYDRFGGSLFIDGEQVIIGTSKAGYVFRHVDGEWIEEERLEAVDDFLVPLPVALSGVLAAVGSPRRDIGSCGDCGEVVIYRFDGLQWLLEATLLPPIFSNNANFGSAVFLNEMGLFVGSRVANGVCSLMRTVHHYEHDGEQWVPVGTLRIPGPSPVIAPSSLAFDGLQGAAGALEWRNGYGLVSSGSVHVFAVGLEGSDCDCDGTVDTCELANCQSDCNSNGVADSCDLTAGTSTDCNDDQKPDECGLGAGDCNANGNPDICDIANNSSLDCNFNAAPDECDISGGFSEDSNGDGVPDECPILPPDAPQITSTFFGTSRFIALEIPPEQPPLPSETALRVDLVTLHQVIPPYFAAGSIQFLEHEGEHRWVGPPAQYRESSSSSQVFFASFLQCTPHYQDWSTVGVLHVTGSEIVPSSRYEVVSVPLACQDNESACGAVSQPLEIATTRWGDVVSPFAPPSAVVEPDIADVSALVYKFRSDPAAPIKATVLLTGTDNGIIDLGADLSFAHISAVVDAYRGLPYPYKLGLCSNDGRSCNVDGDCCCSGVCLLCP